MSPKHKTFSSEGGGTGQESLGPCPLCGREMIPQKPGQESSVDRHHWTPRSQVRPQGKKGEVAVLHKVCHRMLHRLFSDAELATRYNSPESLLTEESVQKFVRWVRRKPPEYVDWPESAGRYGRTGKRGR